ncbi:hypothetical protein [Pseudonocardia zijingensis]|uniref:Xylulose 5-phosphate/Fructose 6-phosphate phosphoketolase N-terminal domain-containing protein n=1 Tax=Pseudonocardia zijingensis TaxID=153376 RepID=A0ABN1Q6L7_9PSEU
MTITAGGGSSAVAGRADVAELERLDAWWRAANYLSVGQIYLLDNPLLTESLRPEHVKPRLLGHWGTTPGLTFLWAHLNRVVVRRGWDALFVAGPGHGGPAVVAAAWLEGTYSERFPDVSRDAAGMRRLFRQFSFPGGVPSHAAPETPGSIHEGGELGYSLAHAYGAALDNPDLLVACVVGDGEAETGPLAASWHANKFLDPVSDGTVLPVLHLNGYKIANPTVLSRIPERELLALLEGYGHEPVLVDVGADEDPMVVHARAAEAMDRIVDTIAGIRARAARGELGGRPRWPVLVLRSPKGWTGPRVVDGLPVEGTWRAHQVPLARVREEPEHLAQLEEWMRSYRPEELFDDEGRPVSGLDAAAPTGERRMSATPHGNGGELLRPLRLPDFREQTVAVPRPGAVTAEATRVAGLAGSTDMRAVLAAERDGRPEAVLAVAVWLHRLRAQIAAMAAALGGLDVLVFSGGIGENAPELRARAVDGLGFLGLALDAGANAAADPEGETDVSAPGARARTVVVHAREDLVIAAEVRRLLAGR